MKTRKSKKMEIINKFVEECKKVLGENLISIILFGSAAKGIENERSDFDLLIVVKKMEKDDILKKIRMKFILKYGAKLDTILMSKKDIIDNFKHFSPLFLSFALGINILYDKGFFEKEYRDFLDKLKRRKIMYYEGGKLWNLQKISSENLQ